MPSLLGATKPKARKDHRCDFCNQIIPKGSVYEKDTYIGDDGLYRWKNHVYCRELAAKLKWFEDWDEGLTGDGFREGVFEEYKEIMTAEGFYSIHTPITFQERLDKVLKHYGLVPTTEKEL